MKVFIISLVILIVGLAVYITLTGNFNTPMGCHWWGRLFILFNGILFGAIAGHSLHKNY